MRASRRAFADEAAFKELVAAAFNYWRPGLMRDTSAADEERS